MTALCFPVPIPLLGPCNPLELKSLRWSVLWALQVGKLTGYEPNIVPPLARRLTENGADVTRCIGVLAITLKSGSLQSCSLNALPFLPHA